MEAYCAPAQHVEDKKYLVCLVVHSLKFKFYLYDVLFFNGCFLLVLTRIVPILSK